MLPPGHPLRNTHTEGDGGGEGKVGLLLFMVNEIVLTVPQTPYLGHPHETLIRGLIPSPQHRLAYVRTEHTVVADSL